MPPGDELQIGGADLRAEAVDEKRNSIAVAETAQRAASLAASNVQHEGSVLNYEDAPTAEDMVTLRRVPNKIPLKLLTIGFIELCERFSYYGTTIVCKLIPSHCCPARESILAMRLRCHWDATPP